MAVLLWQPKQPPEPAAAAVQALVALCSLLYVPWLQLVSCCGSWLSRAQHTWCCCMCCVLSAWALAVCCFCFWASVCSGRYALLVKFTGNERCCAHVVCSRQWYVRSRWGANWLISSSSRGVWPSGKGPRWASMYTTHIAATPCAALCSTGCVANLSCLMLVASC